MKASNEPAGARKPRRAWEQPTMRQVGTVPEVLEGGSGKQSVSSADSGDSRKPQGQG